MSFYPLANDEVRYSHASRLGNYRKWEWHKDLPKLLRVIIEITIT